MWNTVPEKQRIRKLNTTSKHASGSNISHRSFKAEHKKKDKTLDEQPAFGNVTWPLQHTKAGSRTISGPNLATRVRLLSFNRAQTKVVIGLLIRHNTLRRHLYVTELRNNPICWKCGSRFVCVWGAGFTQTLIPRLLLFGPWGY